MQITLNQQEIEKAIIAYIGNQGIVITGNTTVTLVAGRAPNGMSATIDISNESAAAKTVVEVADTKEQPGLSFVASASQDTEVTDTVTEDVKPANKPLFGKD